MKEAKQEIWLGAILILVGLTGVIFIATNFTSTIISFIMRSPLFIIVVISGGVGLLVKGFGTKKLLRKQQEA